MPLPKPQAGESLDDFIPRCMGDGAAATEFPDEVQRMAVCATAYAESVAPKTVDELTAPILWKDEEKRIVYGPVLVPDIADSDGDTVSVAKIEAVAHKFMEEYRLMEHMHTLKSVARPVESYLAPMDLVLGDANIPKGSWIVGAKIQDDKAWEEVRKGDLTGFSIVAVPTGATKSTATKKMTLRDIEDSGQDWEVIAIGLVDKPAVPLAKWTAVKREEENAWDRLRKLFTRKEEETESAKEDDVTPEEIKELIGSSIGDAVGEALKPLTERLDALEKPSGEEDTDKTKTTETVTQEQLEEALEKAAKSGAEEAIASVLVKFEEHLEKSPKVSSKSLTESLRGQDGHNSDRDKVSDTRDPWGRRKKESAKS